MLQKDARSIDLVCAISTSWARGCRTKTELDGGGWFASAAFSGGRYGVDCGRLSYGEGRADMSLAA
jgi:hypothetical protein